MGAAEFVTKPYFETKLGKLYYGDCLEIMQRLDVSGYALLTDPLYGENQKNNSCSERKLRGLTLKRKNWIPIADIKALDPAPFLLFDQAIIWGGNYIANLLPPSRCWIIWDKLHIPPDNHHDCEMAWTNLKGVTRIHRQLWRGICREGEENISNGPKLHPFQKPIRLMCFCVQQFKGQPAIFDPYAGSSTVAIACERLGRNWIGIELLEEFCEVSAQRLEREVEQLKLFA